MDLLLATRNPHKVREFRELLGKNFKLFDLTAFPEIAIPEETGRTFEENATLKAIAASQLRDSSRAEDRPAFARLRRGRHLLVVADDSGLEVDALGGEPGIYSARYAGENADARENISKLLGELSARNVADEKRSARFRCVIALARNRKLLGTFEGVVEGDIVDPPRGTGGFGYDSVFQPAGFAQTFAEMPPELKNEISHRAQAVAALRAGLRDIEN
jgi:XTP/dITP diphosphohydrolase